MEQVLQQLDKVVDTRVTVLVEGETGTGKELFASAIHYRSQRRDKLFVAQNCAAFPEKLLESELFGHKRGAFTGATDEKKGLFEIADGGTLFLDEVGEMPLALQAKLLRVLQEGEIRADRRDGAATRERAHRGRHQPQPRERGRGGPLPRRPVLPAEGVSAAGAAAARAARGRPAARGALSWSATRASSGARSRGFTQQALELLCATTGPATCASWRTRCSAP